MFLLSGGRQPVLKRSTDPSQPQPPMSSRFWGHLPIAGDCKRLFPPDVHVQNWANYIRKKYDLGGEFYVHAQSPWSIYFPLADGPVDFYYLDFWPLGPRWLFIADPELASKYITTGQSLPKSRLTTGFLTRLLGANNMVGLEGQQWKLLRSIFNPGFSASHLNTLIPYIVDASLVFLDILREKAQTNELVSLDTYSTRFTIDIIGKVVMEADFESQLRPHPIVTTFRKQVDLMPSSTSIGPLDDINLVREVRLWWNARKLDSLIGAEIDKRIALRTGEQQLQREQANGTSDKKTERKRAIVDLALDLYEKEAASGPPGAKSASMTSSFRTTAIDSVKTFIFAGHDTTSATISYVMYLLHLHKPVHDKIVTELDSVFGADSTAGEIASTMKSDPHIINRLEYLNAVIKETLRLFPPASTLRELHRASDVQAAKASSFTDPKTGKTYPIRGFDVWPVAHMIHRNEAFFPEPAKFVPERFIASQTPYPFPQSQLHTPAGKDAWRPFEKGPRNCVGQELAMMETKVVLGLILKEVDFTAEYAGAPVERWTPVETSVEYADGVPGVQRMTIEGHRPYQVLRGAARPRDGMTGRLSLRAPSK